MTLNYLLLTVTAILSISGIIEIVRGTSPKINIFRTIGSIVAFAIALIATLKGIDYPTFKIMIESALGGK
jgi:hypothetical protein